MKKVARLYIDGFIFCHSIYNNKELHRCICWCDFRKLAERDIMSNMRTNRGKRNRPM